MLIVVGTSSVPEFSIDGLGVRTGQGQKTGTVLPGDGRSENITFDQGSEFISRDLDLWAYQKDVVLHFSRPGKPTDNSFIESFNGKFRAEPEHPPVPDA